MYHRCKMTNQKKIKTMRIQIQNLVRGESQQERNLLHAIWKKKEELEVPS